MNTPAWYDIVVEVLKRHKVKLVTYVPDNVLSPLIERLRADPFFTTLGPAREEEAVGIVTGAYMAGMRGIVLMQTSGFATLPNVLASLVRPYQIPLLMMISERGTMGDHQLGQAMVCRTMVPILNSMGIETHRMVSLEDLDFMADGMIRQAYSTQEAAAMLLSPLLTKKRSKEL
ncbi:thiamine pyrophosphate-binding protein [Candidimonas nitroreducens]|uniref:Decarboxylase n=1 Tax=Candidimonas nitroreducens TaxID=683354 RepID=A0A225MX43_9BURK|nr:thiamine pyrophosphate-binding protein [Candidimonas nitroreducens]OWT65838.1 decarboxylase [Candidimonas nitroreducens]